MLNILVVDDSLIIRKNLKKYIANLGHTVIGESKTGKMAVADCERLKPDLITMDITMPDMDGIKAVELIKEFDEKVNILMVTSHGQEEMVVSALKAGAKGYILKPVNEEKLAQGIAGIFENHVNNLDEDDDFFE